MAKQKTPRWINSDSTALFNTIRKLGSLKETQNFFRDLLTEYEIKEFSARWKVAQMLNKKIPYKQIEAETKMSPTTISRISRDLKKGQGGYRKILRKTKNH